jgi:tetratricopeptide (TPR) repeat protein
MAMAACGPVPPRDPFYLAEAKDSLERGYHWFQVGCHKEAVRFFDESLVSARLSDNVPYIVMSLNAKGASHLARGDMAKAAPVLNEALELTLAEPGQPELPALLGNLGTLSYQAGRFDDAKGFWEKAAEEALPRGASPAPYLANLARLELAKGTKESFSEALDLAMASAGNPNTPESAKSDILNMAAVRAMGRGDLSAASTYLESATAIDRKLENQSGLAQDLETRHELQSLQGDHPAAMQSLARAFYLRASLQDLPALKKDLALLREGNKAYGHPADLTPFEAIAKKPELFDPLKEYCP